MKKVQLLFITTLISFCGFTQSKRALFVMSAANEITLKNGKKHQTGVFLNEFYLAYKGISEAGYAIDFATPNGIKATIDNESLDDKYWKNQTSIKQEAIAFVESNQAFNQPIRLEDISKNQEQYAGLVVPGGQGLMVDLIENQSVKDLLKSFGKNQKAVGLICHAPALLTVIPKDENPFVGYKVNSVSGFEEFYIEKLVMKGKPQRRKIGKKLKQSGLKHTNAGPGKDFAVRDRNLVTSQNPFSNNSFTKYYLEALQNMKQ
jgi:putative intracellular protease/amidase